MEVISRHQEHSWGKQIMPLLRAPPALNIHFVAYLVAHRSTAWSPLLFVVTVMLGWPGRTWK